MATIKRFEEIQAWISGRELTNIVYDLTAAKPFDRDVSLRDQLRRSAVSIISNIAEGFESRTQSLFIDFLGRAKGSAGEVRAQLYIALDRGYINQQQFEHACTLAELISRRLYRLISYLESQPKSRRVTEDRVEYQLEL